MVTLNEILTSNQLAAKWFQLLSVIEQQTLTPIINQILATTERFNKIFQGYQVYITGSSLNFLERTYNDIDLMVVIPQDNLVTGKKGLLAILRESFRAKNISSLREAIITLKVRLFGLQELLDSTIDSIDYSIEISNSNQEALLRRLGSANEVTRLLMDPTDELTAIKLRTEGLIDAEKQVLPVELDGTQGYQFGPLVEVFLEHVMADLIKPASDGQPLYQVNFQKSFPEGYGKIAGENNCYIYPKVQCPPVHLFLTTGVDQKKAMEKKDSFMLEYYTELERMQPIRIY
ncbi:MAG: hypothetical protein KAJ51_11800 [Thermoplasmata archaeon]|nr:hypothetical protein [Thermoplasmata archaeon]